MKNFSKLLGTSLFLGVLASGGVVAQEKQEINFGIISTESSQNLRQVWEPFLEDMSEITGYQVNAFFASDYAGIIQAMRFDKVDIAWLGNKSAMEAVDRAGGEVIYQTIDSNGDGGYWSLLIAHKDSPLNSVEDVLAQAKDLNFGNGDPNSTSGFLVPGYYVFAQNNVDPKQTRLKQLPRMIEAIETASADNILRAEHFLHLRCEVSHERTLDIFKDLVQAHPALRLVSVMDHTPGQRQFVKYEKYKEYYQGKYHLSESELEAFIVRQKANGAKYSDLFRQEIVAVCQDKGIAIASHDDATLEHVEESAALGMSIAEFPTTDIAAARSHELGLKVLMGAPNVVRGGSHSGNIAAADLAREGVLDILSSDYYPSSLLRAVKGLADLEGGYDLAKAVSTVSLAPAQSVNLQDRGQIKVGLRADLVAVKEVNDQFVINQVWRQGQRVF